MSKHITKLEDIIHADLSTLNLDQYCEMMIHVQDLAKKSNNTIIASYNFKRAIDRRYHDHRNDARHMQDIEEYTATVRKRTQDRIITAIKNNDPERIDQIIQNIFFSGAEESQL